MAYNISNLIGYCLSRHINISPQDRQDWAMFCCALKVLGFDVNTFVELSNPGAEIAARIKWKEERSPGRYLDEDRAAAKIVALAKDAGVDIMQFKDDCRMTLPNSRSSRSITRNPTPQLQPIYIEQSAVDNAAAMVEISTLYKFLCRKFNVLDVQRVLNDYRVGALDAFAQFWPGVASAFPLINSVGLIVDVHLVAYDDEGHRRKDPDMWKCQNWLLKKMRQNERRGTWPLFGEHLTVSRKQLPIGIVESEKTAIIASIAAPMFVWCATCGITNLTPERLSAIKGRDIYLFPDLDGISTWRSKAEALVKNGFGSVYLCDQYIINHAQYPKDDLGDIILNNS